MFLFPGMPGGIELLVIFLIVVVLFGVPLAIVALGVVLVRGSRGDGDVEDEVARLREEVAELRAAIGAGADERADVTERGCDAGTGEETTTSGTDEPDGTAGE